METSLDAWKFTPRWNIESYPGNQVFLFNRLRYSYSLLSISGIYVGAASGFVNRSHFTYFYSYNSWGLDDSEIWLMSKGVGTIAFLGKLGLPTGNYKEGLGNGAYCFGLYVKKRRFLRNSNVYLGYKWLGKNPDNVDYGDNIHLALDVDRWLRITTYYAFADHGDDFPLYDSPSFSLGISIYKELSFINTYRVKVVFNQILLGRDTEMTSSISFTISNRKERKDLHK